MSFIKPEPLPFPVLPYDDEMTQADREASSIEARDRTVFHLKAIKYALLQADVEPDSEALTRFASQVYLEGFRGAIFGRKMAQLKAENQLQALLPFDPKATSH